MPLDPAAPLPLVTADLPGTGGVIKAAPEDFEVEEVPAYDLSGQGDHLFLWVEKRGVGAEYFARQVARRLGIATDDVGLAGLKDRHAVTRQWVSVPGHAGSRLAALDGDGITLLSHTRHGNKLKPGHLRGNRFRILVRGVTDPAPLPALVERLRSHGVPNYYGPQRFGRDGETFNVGWDLLRGEHPVRASGFLRRLGLSAVQSALFNAHVAARLRDGLLRTVLPGDAMKKWPFGGMFNADDVAAEQARLDARETVPAGPMFGKKMFKAKDEAQRREAQTLADAGLTMESFADQGRLMTGTRRYSFVYPDDLTAEVEPGGVRLTFTLPAGSYATVLVRELTHTDRLEAEDADE